MSLCKTMYKKLKTKTFDKNLGIKLISSHLGKSKLELKVKNEHLNHGGILHGGVISSLCDCALAEAIHNKLNKNEWCVTIQLNIEYLEPGYLGETIHGIGIIKRKGKHLAFVEGAIVSKGREIARAHGIWFIKEGQSKKIVSKQPIKRMD